jgi:hypothetical protein
MLATMLTRLCQAYNYGNSELEQIIQQIDLQRSDLSDLTSETLLSEYDVFKRSIYRVMWSRKNNSESVSSYVQDWKSQKRLRDRVICDWDAYKVFESFTKDPELYTGIQNFLWFYEYCYSICHVECTCETVASKMKLHSHNRTISPETMKKETIIDWQFFKPGEHADKFLGEVIDSFLESHEIPLPEMDGMSHIGHFLTKSRVLIRKKSESKSRLGSVVNELNSSVQN